MLNGSSILSRAVRYFQSKPMWAVISSPHLVNDSGRRSLSVRNDLVDKVDPYLLNYGLSDSQILTRLKPIDVERMKMIEEEFSFLKEHVTYLQLPETLSDQLMVSLLRQTSYTRRIKVYRKHYLLSKLKKKQSKQEELKKQMPSSELRVSRMPRMVKHISKSSMTRFYNTRLFSLLQNGDAQKLIFDFSFEDELDLKGIYHVANQIRMLMGRNRLVRDPFDLVLSGLERDSRQFYILSKLLGIYDASAKLVRDIDDIPYTRTDTCVLESAAEESKKDLVYLTPHSPYLLRHFDHSKTYIVGALNENRCPSTLTLLKARRLNIRHARLPVTKFSDFRGRWQSGWSLIRVFFVLHSIKITGKYPRPLRE